MPAVSPEILKQVKAIELRTRGLVGSLFAGEYRSVFRGQGMEFAEVRAYEAGDDFRSIDWNVSARLGSPYVKTFTEERELTLMLLVDQSGSTRFGEPVTKAALAVEVAAVLALAAAHQNDRVGALLFADEVERVIPPRKGRRHALRVIRDLVAFEPAGRRTNLAASLSYASRLLRHRSIVVVLSDFIAEGWERPLRRLAARHEVVAITVDDPREHELPESGWIEMHDAEIGPAGAGRHREAATCAARVTRARRAQRREERSRALGAAGADQVHLATGVPYALPLRARVRPRARAGSTADDARTGSALQDSARRARPSATRSGSAARSPSRPGATLRPADWDAPEPIERLGRAAGHAARRLGRVGYPIVVWRTGPLTVDLPGPLLLGAGGSSRLAAAAAGAASRSRACCPAVPPDSTLAPQPRADFVPADAAPRRCRCSPCWCSRRCCWRRSTGGGGGADRRVRGRRCRAPGGRGAARALGRRGRIARGGARSPRGGSAR